MTQGIQIKTAHDNLIGCSRRHHQAYRRAYGSYIASFIAVASFVLTFEFYVLCIIGLNFRLPFVNISKMQHRDFLL